MAINVKSYVYKGEGKQKGKKFKLLEASLPRHERCTRKRNSYGHAGEGGILIEYNSFFREILISSNVPSWGSIPVYGKNEMRLLRDALIKICEIAGIK